MTPRSGRLVTDAELLAEMIGPPLLPEAAGRVLDSVGGLRPLLDLDTEALRQIGLPLEAARRFDTMREWLERSQAGFDDPRSIHSTADAWLVVRPTLRWAVTEILLIVCLDRAGHVVHKELLAIGAAACRAVCPARVLAVVTKHRARRFVLARSVDRKDLMPTRSDLELAHEVGVAASKQGVSLVDHLLVVGDYYWSVGEELKLSARPEVAKLAA